MIFVGVDPGASGAIALLTPHGEADTLKLKDATPRDILEFLSIATASTFLGGDGAQAHGVLEKVHAMPKQGVSSTFKFGASYGGLEMALTAAGVSFTQVTPQKWQKAMGCLSKGDKNVTKRRAQELFPGVKITHAVADALLMAEYCRRENT